MPDADKPATRPRERPWAVLHRIGFVTNTMLQGAVAGALLVQVVELLLLYLALWLLPDLGLDAFARAVVIAVASFLSAALGAVLGGIVGIPAGARNSNWHDTGLAPVHRSLPGALLHMPMTAAGCVLAAALVAMMGGLNLTMPPWAWLVLGIPCAFLGVLIGGYVSLTDVLTLRGLVFTLIGGVIGITPAAVAALIVLGTDVADRLPDPGPAAALILAGGAIGGALLGHLVEMRRRGIDPEPA